MLFTRKKAGGDKKIKAKYQRKVQRENSNVTKFSKKSFTMAGMTSQELKTLQEDKDVIIEKDYLLEGSDAVSDNELHESIDAVAEGAWDVEAINTSNAEITVEKKVKVAVLDSGLDKFSKLVVDGCVNFVDPETDDIGVDTTCHGTAVQNIIMSDETRDTKSVASEDNGVSMYSVKVLDESNQAPVSRIVSAVHWCIDNDIDIINMSFGSLVHSQVLEQAVKEAADAGILMIAAVGNGGAAEESTVEYPAAFDEVVGVGSVNRKMEVSEFSSRGDEVELVAPGENIPVSVPWGFYGVQHGISFAAPHVTAVAGMLWAQDSTKSAEEIRSLLRASANGEWEEAGSGIVDFAYAEELLPEYECSEETEVSDTNKSKLQEYDVPETVQARWCSNAIYILENPIPYTHDNLITISGKSNLIVDKNELQLLNYIVKFADNQNFIPEGSDHPLSECRVMHAGRYEKDGVNNYSNYVAACRCLYNCAYLIASEDASKARLKDYVNNHYDSGEQSDSSIDKAKKDLRIIINAAYDKDLNNKLSDLSWKRIRIIQFLGFAIHAATDAFSHQYVIDPRCADGIINNTQIERLQGSLTFNNKPVKTNIIFQSNAATKAMIKSGKCNTKDLDMSATEPCVMECHKYYADNLSFAYVRYDTGAKDCVAEILSLFGGSKFDKFDPRVFINNTYADSSAGIRIPIWNLYENVSYAGYAPEMLQKGASTQSGMKTIWKQLSSWE